MRILLKKLWRLNPFSISHLLAWNVAIQCSTALLARQSRYTTVYTVTMRIIPWWNLKRRRKEYRLPFVRQQISSAHHGGRIGLTLTRQVKSHKWSCECVTRNHTMHRIVYCRLHHFVYTLPPPSCACTDDVHPFITIHSTAVVVTQGTIPLLLLALR